VQEYIFSQHALFALAILCAPTDRKSNPQYCSTCTLLYIAVLSHWDSAL